MLFQQFREKHDIVYTNYIFMLLSNVYEHTSDVYMANIGYYEQKNNEYGFVQSLVLTAIR